MLKKKIQALRIKGLANKALVRAFIIPVTASLFVSAPGATLRYACGIPLETA